MQEFKLVEPKISKDIFNYVSLENSVSGKNSYGGTNIKQVLKAIKRAKKKNLMQNKTFIKLIIFFCLISFMSCGKKSSLDKYPGSDYPRNYPNND